MPVLKERPLFILMDINPPCMDGLETMKQTRSSGTDNSIPIITITSYAMSRDRKRILAVGCNIYFVKPSDPITITDQVHMIPGKTANCNSHCSHLWSRRGNSNG
jgi:CheY-like chemotaxis protein